MFSGFPRFAYALLFITVALFAFGQEQKDRAKATASLSGTVVSASDNTPIRGAIVFVYSTPGESQKNPSVERETTRTAADGSFSFDKLSPGRYSLSISKPGFTGIQKTASARPMRNIEVTLAPDQKLGNQNFRLVPSSVIVGRVIDEEGAPLMNLRVEARRWTFANGKRMLERIGDTVFPSTNDLGEYRLYGLLPGRYYVVVSPMWYMDAPNGRLLKTYYSNSRSIDNATPIVLTPGDEVRADFNLAHVPGVKVKGTLTGALVETNSGRFIVELRGDERSSRVPVEVDEDGSFEADNVTPGDYVLVASTFEMGEMSGPKEVARTKIEVPTSGVQNLSIPVIPVPKEKGEIQGLLASSEKEFRPGGYFVVLEKSDSDQDDEKWGSTAYGAVKPDGTFKLNSPEPGSYQVRVFLQGSGSPYTDWYIESVDLNGRDVTNKSLDLAPSATGRLHITMSSKSCTLDGAVSDSEGKPLAQAQILLLPSDGNQRPDLYQTSQSDQNGHFKLRGIVPYSYKVVALADEDADAAADPSFVKSLASRGTPVHLEPGAKQAITLKVTTDAPQQ